MRGLVGSLRAPKGGFGNRVMSFLSLRQIASAFGTRYFSTNDIDRRRVGGIHSKPPVPLSFLKLELASPEEAFEPDGIAKLRERVHLGVSVGFNRPLLGEVFARFAPTGSIRMPQMRCKVCSRHIQATKGTKLGALHFRGGDFAAWNPGAVLPEAYYHSAIDLALGYLPEIKFRIFADDYAHPAIEGVRNRLQQSGLLLESISCEKQLECDHASIASASLVVSTPSTFALTAAMFGEGKVIHSERWVTNRVEEGELFWKLVREKKLPRLEDSEFV